MDFSYFKIAEAQEARIESNEVSLSLFFGFIVQCFQCIFRLYKIWTKNFVKIT